MTDTRRGMFTSAHELLDGLRARQAELGLSNAALDDICGWPGGGVVDKYLGPSRTKWPGLDVIFRLMYALGLSGELHVDPRKVERMTLAWRTEGKRKVAAIRNENPRISQAMVKRAAPAVRLAFATSGGLARWDGVPAGERAAHVARMNAVRLERHRNRLASKRR